MTEIRKEQVYTEIVQMLELKSSFNDTIYSILEKSGRCVDVTNACLLQVCDNDNSKSLLIEYTAGGTDKTDSDSRQLDKLDIYKDTMFVANADTLQPGLPVDSVFSVIRSAVTIPVVVNDRISLYVVYFDMNNKTEWNDDDLQFISGVAKVIQSIAQVKHYGKYLDSSFLVLKDILSNISSGIIVSRKDSKDIIFENRIASESEDISRIMREAVKDRFVPNSDSKTFDGNSTDDKTTKSNSYEWYDSASGLWFEIQFSEMTWIDESQVMICSATDITLKKKNQQKIEYQAHNDYLTGLFNRIKCEKDLEDVVKTTIENGQDGAVLFIDLDDFKHINDALGHKYGDVLLQQISIGLQSVSGLRGSCYRMGGDEFIIIVHPDNFIRLERIITTITDLFNKPWFIMETEYYCTMSMGIVKFPESGADVNELIKKADIAMYEAKKSGKNRYSFYDEDNDGNSTKRLDVENNMRLAVAAECSEFLVYYQPVVDTFSGECVSCEALVRWNSKALGFMSPAEFIPLAEYLGLINNIGDYVLEDACTKCREWNEKINPDFRVNINLSVVQILQRDFVDNIGRILGKTGVNPSNIVLEITESFAINDMKRVMKIIEDIRTLGPQVALDDFGTGYSSLNYIKQLSLDLIKVDKTFIDDIVEDDYAQAFIKFIVQLSKAIGTKICVEGVEKEEQYEVLKKLGVDYIQGYYFGKPINAIDFEKDNLNVVPDTGIDTGVIEKMHFEKLNNISLATE